MLPSYQLVPWHHQPYLLSFVHERDVAEVGILIDEADRSRDVHSRVGMDFLQALGPIAPSNEAQSTRLTFPFSYCLEPMIQVLSTMSLPGPNAIHFSV